jgi:hypothetical protein
VSLNHLLACFDAAAAAAAAAGNAEVLLENNPVVFLSSSISSIRGAGLKGIIAIFPSRACGAGDLDVGRL